MDDVLTIEAAAELAGRNVEAMRKAAQRGRLVARKVGRQWLTTPAAVARYSAEVEAWRAPGRVGRSRAPRSARMTQREVDELVPD